MCRLCLEPEGRGGEAGRARRAGAAGVRGRRRRPRAVHRLLARLRKWRPCAGRWTRGSRRTSGRLTHARQAGHLPPESDACRAACPRLRHDPRGGAAGVAGRARATSRAGPLAPMRTGPGRWRCSAASTRRARSSPRRVRSWPSAAAESLLADITAFESAEFELLAGDPAAAAEFGSRRVQAARGAGRTELPVDRGGIARAGALRARPARRGRRLGRAAQTELGASDDATTQMLWRQARAKVLARRGEHAEAERLAREAVAIGEKTDMLNGARRRVRRPRRGAPAHRQGRRGSSRARASARALRAQGKPRHGATDARSAGGRGGLDIRRQDRHRRLEPLQPLRFVSRDMSAEHSS